MARDPGGGGIYRPTRPDDRAAPRPTARKVRSARPDDRPGPRQTSATKALDARAKRLDRLAREIGAGRVPAKRGAQVLRSLRLNDEERQMLGELTGKYSAEVQDRIDPQERIAGYLVGPELAKVLPGGSPASEASPGWAAVEAAGLLPVGRGLGLLGRGGRAAKAAAKAQDAAPVADDAAKAAARGVMESLGDAPKLRGEQNALRRAERAKRIGKADEIASEVGGVAGHRAAKASLRGELPTVKLTSLVKHYGEADSELRAVMQPQVDELVDMINASPALRPWEKVSAREVFLKALDGRVTTARDDRLLAKVFGEEAEQFLRQRRLANNVVRVMNLPRSMQATADLSFPFRQGLPMIGSHPRVWGRAWAPMIKAARSKEFYRLKMAEIEARPTYDAMKEAGVKFTDLGGVTTRDEGFISDLAEQIPLFGRVAGASNRAFVTFGNALRADVFDLLYEQANNAGRMSRRDLKGIASVVNAGTGRGNMGAETLEKAAPFLTLGLFSPRLIASRLAYLNPAWYYKMGPIARREAARQVVTLVAAGNAVLWLASQIPGVQVGQDPRSADFGKIRVGDTRIDIWGGFQQYVVNAYKIAKKESVSSSSGKVETLEGGFAKKSRYDIAMDFAWGKAAPVPGFVARSWKGKNFEGDEFDELREGGKAFLPLGVQGAYDAYKETDDPLATAGLFGLNFVGVGSQTYPDKAPKKKSSRRRGGGGGIYGGGSSRKSGGGIYGR